MANGDRGDMGIRPDQRDDTAVSALDMLDHALKLLVGEFLPAMAAADLGARCVALVEARRRLDGVIATSTAEADRAGVPARAGTRTIAQYVSSRTHLSPAVVRGDVRVGRWVSVLPLVEEAMIDGRLSREHCDHLRRLQNPRVSEAARRDQHLFVEWAQDLEWKSFVDACAYWLKVNDQDGAEPEHQEVENSLVFARNGDGRVTGSFDLDPISGEILMQQIGDEANVLFNHDNEHGVVSTVCQRRARALTNVICRGAGRTASTAKPLIHVVMSLNVLNKALDQLGKDPSERALCRCLIVMILMVVAS